MRSPAQATCRTTPTNSASSLPRSALIPSMIMMKAPPIQMTADETCRNFRSTYQSISPSEIERTQPRLGQIPGMRNNRRHKVNSVFLRTLTVPTCEPLLQGTSGVSVTNRYRLGRGVQAMFKVAVMVGSIRPNSSNLQFARALEKLALGRLQFDFIDLGALPFYDETLWDDPPASVLDMKQRIAAADGVLFVTPEYNRSIPGVLK